MCVRYFSATSLALMGWKGDGGIDAVRRAYFQTVSAGLTHSECVLRWRWLLTPLSIFFILRSPTLMLAFNVSCSVPRLRIRMSWRADILASARS